MSLPVTGAGVLLLLALCVLIAACGGGTTNLAAPGNPVATIDLNNLNGSPTPGVPAYLCGAWVTNTSPGFSPNRIIAVYAKFVHIDASGNPQGVGNADGTASINWPDGTSDEVTAKTTADGLAVFPIILKADSVGKIVLVEVTFTKDGQTCTIPQPAYFTPIPVSPTVTPPPSDNGSNGTPGTTGTPGTPNETPTPTPIVPPRL